MKKEEGLLRRLFQILSREDRDHFTTAEVRLWLGEEPQAVNDLLSRLTTQGVLKRLRRGIYTLGTLPPTTPLTDLQPLRIPTVNGGQGTTCPLQSQGWNPGFVPSFLRTIDRQGCLSFQTAMQFHRAQPLTPPFLLVTSRRHRPGQQTPGEIQFITRSRNYLFGFTESDGLRFSDLEKTWVDCLHRPDLAGGFARLFDFLTETRPRLNPLRLVNVLRRYPALAPLRRLLCLVNPLELVGIIPVDCRTWQRTGSMRLDPSGPASGLRDGCSGVIINTSLDGDSMTAGTPPEIVTRRGGRRESLTERIHSKDPSIAATAITQLIERQKFRKVCEELAISRETLITRFGADQVDRWLKRLLENNMAARGHHWLFAIRAQATALKGNIPRAVDWLQKRVHLVAGTTEERFTHYTLGNLAMMAGQLTLAGVALRHALFIDEQSDDKVHVAQDRMALGTLAGIQEDYSTARSLYLQSLQDYRDLNQPSKQFMVLCNIGSSLHTEGRAREAMDCFNDARTTIGILGDPMMQTTLCLHLAEVADSRGEGRVATAQYREAARLQRMLRLAGARFDTMAALIRCQLKQGLFNAASDSLKRLIEQRIHCPPEDRYDRTIHLRQAELALCNFNFPLFEKNIQFLNPQHRLIVQLKALKMIFTGMPETAMGLLKCIPTASKGQSRGDIDQQLLVNALLEISTGSESSALEISRPVLDQMRQDGRRPGWDEWFFPLYLALIPRRSEERKPLTGTPTRWRRQPPDNLVEFCLQLLQSRGLKTVSQWIQTALWIPEAIRTGLQERLPRIGLKSSENTWLIWTRDGCGEADSDDLRTIHSQVHRYPLLYNTSSGELHVSGKAKQHLNANTIPGRLLTHFIRHATIPLEACELYRDIWDDSFLPETGIRTLQVHIARLRRFLESVPGRPELLRTVKTPMGEVAYQLVADDDFCLILPAEDF